MGSNINKIYNKAMDYYQKGELDKAINKCEEGISINLKSSNLLNLKGLLLYLKGDLSEAITVWKINSDYNNDDIAKIYIKDSKKDDEKLKLYQWVEKDIKDLRIDDALLKLNKCAESDFNSINVNTSFAICYLRKGNYILAKEYNEKALKINSKNKVAIEIRNQIKNFEENPVEKFKGNIVKVVVAVAIIGIVTTTLIIFIGRINNKVVVDDKIENHPEQEEIIQDLIIEENIDKSNNIEEKVEKEEEPTEPLLSDEQMKDAYIKGSDYFNSKEYDKAIEILSKAYKNSTDMYLKDDMLFFLASSYDKSNLKNDAIKYYEEYVKTYSNENYIIEVYYNLALNYKDNDINKSKEYARIIKDKYSDSMYNNSNIETILSN